MICCKDLPSDSRSLREYFLSRCTAISRSTRVRFTRSYVRTCVYSYVEWTRHVFAWTRILRSTIVHCAQTRAVVIKQYLLFPCIRAESELNTAALAEVRRNFHALPDEFEFKPSTVKLGAIGVFCRQTLGKGERDEMFDVYLAMVALTLLLVDVVL